MLIAKGATVNAQNNKRYTPLHIAAEKNHIEVVKILVEKADVNAEGIEDKTPLHLAAAKGHKDVVETLIANKVRGCPETSKRL
ncbi:MULTISPECIES: ankyrin repeat domain-containing protein [unclassified Wolbachia]|uniref:ankyrin repeat domain-containing protein n=1 Tax=unclassified Wolbachia TaxID=2640676 RepID=UPI001FEA62A4|nr:MULTISPECIES: ankyrin repeat domain-containing protein [unclassified Wolbachia]